MLKIIKDMIITNIVVIMRETPTALTVIYELVYEFYNGDEKLFSFTKYSNERTTLFYEIVNNDFIGSSADNVCDLDDNTMIIDKKLNADVLELKGLNDLYYLKLMDKGHTVLHTDTSEKDSVRNLLFSLV
ncbi:hypothetical protein MKC79_09680 [[Clostridium] innocuum]|nr:hypothetical protein [[Clostridium] innocuum]